MAVKLLILNSIRIIFSVFAKKSRCIMAGAVNTGIDYQEIIIIHLYVVEEDS